jgi:hypothetical protein
VKVFILSAYPEPENFVSKWLIAAAAEDTFRVHTLVDNPDDAELILFAEGHTSVEAYYWSVWNHPVRRRYPERCLLYHDQDFVLPLLPGLYPALEIRDFDRAYAVGAPYFGRITENPIKGALPPADGADSLLYSFVGSVPTHPVRGEIMKLGADERAHCEDSGAAHWWTLEGDALARYLARFSDITRRSKFVLCPRGASPSTYRLYETMEAGRAPVIVSDAFTPPLGPDWSTFSLRVPEAEVASIPDLLRRREGAAQELGARARAAWELWFAPAVCFHRTVEACNEIRLLRARAGGRDPRLRYLKLFLTDFHLKMLYRVVKGEVSRFWRGERAR